MIYAFSKETGEVLDEFRNVAEAADRMETRSSTITQILEGNKSDLCGVGLIEHAEKEPLRPVLRMNEKDPR